MKYISTQLKDMSFGAGLLNLSMFIGSGFNTNYITANTFHYPYSLATLSVVILTTIGLIWPVAPSNTKKEGEEVNL